MALSRLIKLVRDNHSAIHGDVAAVEFKEMEDDEYWLQLQRKLLEEATEFVLEPSLEELGDVMDVIDAIIFHYYNEEIDEFNRLRLWKHNKYGGFYKGVGMYGSTPDR
jgi:predicted house-cleaning noncanonical NTP pyrophosphatase (MazG superfamily)